MNFNMQMFQQIGQFMKGIKQPKEAVFNLLSNNTTPIAQNVLKLYKNGDIESLKQLAMNMCKEKGVNYDEALNNIKSGLGM